MTTDTFAEKAIRSILAAMGLYSRGVDIRKVCADEMLTAACYAGIAFLSAGCGLVHGMSYPLSGKYFVTHGAANYVFFDAVLKYYDSRDPYGRIADFRAMVSEALGCDEKDAIQALADAEDALIKVKKMSEYGAEEADIKVFTKSVFENQMRLVNNACVPVGPEEVRDLYRQVL